MASDPGPEPDPSALIDAQLEELGDWRGGMLARVRELVHQAVPDVDEQVKWRKPTNPNGVPVWAADGIICTGEAYTDKVKLTFASGAALEDPAGLFNASLGGKVRRAIDLREGDELDEAAFIELVQAAAHHNAGGGVRLLAGGNPQIPKADGDEPVQAYIAAMPGWKSDIGRRLDALVERTVPGVQKAVKWNNPLYGLEDERWFFNFRCYTKYVKVAFFCEDDLDPLPPIDAADPNTRYVHIHEGDELDEELLASWIQQAAAAPGWVQ